MYDSAAVSTGTSVPHTCIIHHGTNEDHILPVLRIGECASYRQYYYANVLVAECAECILPHTVEDD
eukprot:scaffold2882_cov434-Prasinococcus_capsulatus_cf.AAC.10